MFNRSKKGFTIVELIIVIAVIAVLAAVLIPTFSNLIQQAQEAKDTALVSDLNKGLAMSGTKFDTVHEAVKAVEENIGINVAKITATATENEILFDSENNCFVYLKDNKINYIPDTQKTPVGANEQYKYWQFVNTYATSSDFSQYLTGTDTKEVTVHAGFDVGDNIGVDVTYTTASEQEVTIRTNGGTLTVNAEKANVKHYGAADLVDVQAVKGESFHEFGKAAVVNVKSGHFVAESTAVILNVHVEATTASVKQESGAKVIAYTKDKEIESEVKVAGTETTITETATTSEVTKNAKESGVVAEGGVAEIDGVQFESLQKAFDAAKDGDTVKLLADIDLDVTVFFRNDYTVTFDANGKRLLNTNDLWDKVENGWSLISVNKGKLTIVGNGSFEAKSGDCYAVDVQDGAECVIENGTFVGNIHAVYVQKGTLTVNGGTYKIQQTYPTAGKEYEFVLNCLDETRANGTAKIVVTGGTFQKFNPTNCYAEGAGTNFCGEGYSVTESIINEGGTDYTYYTIVKTAK